MFVILSFIAFQEVSMDAQKLLDAADQTMRAREYVKARAAYEKALAAGEKEKNRQIQAEALAQIARCYSLVPDLKEGRVWLARAKELASDQDPLGWSRYLGVRGIFEREEGDRARAKATFIEMYEYATKRNLHSRALDAAHHVAIVAESTEQVEWAKKGIAAAEKANDERWLAVFWNNLGATYEDLKEYDRCLDAYLKAREYHHKVSDETSKLAADWAVGRGYRFTGKIDQAKEWQTKTLAWARQRYAKEAAPQNAEWVGYSLQEMGEILAAQGKSKNALEHLRESRKFWIEAGLDKHWPEGLAQLDARIAELSK